MTHAIPSRGRVGALPLLLVAAVVLSACTFRLPFRLARTPPPRNVAAVCDPTKGACIAVKTPDENTVFPKPRPGDAAAPVTPRSAAALDTSSPAEKRAARKAAAKPQRERRLGKTIATLGAVGEPGFWLKTPLVKTAIPGRIVWAANGNSIKAVLMPKPGPKGGGSQISLAAMRALEVPLTGLPELLVFESQE